MDRKAFIKNTAIAGLGFSLLPWQARAEQTHASIQWITLPDVLEQKPHGNGYPLKSQDLVHGPYWLTHWQQYTFMKNGVVQHPEDLHFLTIKLKGKQPVSLSWTESAYITSEYQQHPLSANQWTVLDTNHQIKAIQLKGTVSGSVSEESMLVVLQGEATLNGRKLKPGTQGAYITAGSAYTLSSNHGAKICLVAKT